MKMSRMVKVDYMYENGSVPNSSYIEEAFTTATNVGDQIHLFSTIFIPIHEPITEDGEIIGISDNITYHNVGMTITELAEAYWNEFSGNYLIGAGPCKTIEEDAQKLTKRITSVFKKNLGKYRKLIELYGLVWNPLWNVDGTELHQLLESHGDEANIRTMSARELQGRNNRKTHDTTPYDGTDYRSEWREDETGQSSTASGTVTTTYGSDTYSAQATATDVAFDTGSAETSLDKKTHEQISYSVNASDTVFGTGLSGADIMHTEKTVRQGNIGVTETTKLLEDARQWFRFNIIDEFFKDINEVILIGIYCEMETVPWWEAVQHSGGGSGGGGGSSEHPDTGRISSVYNSFYDMIQSVELDEYGHVVGLTTCDGVTRMSTPMTEEEFEATDPKDLPLYYVYDDET